jgi:excisionase family DNA binding protein
MEELLTIKDVASILRVDPTTVRRYILEERFPAMKLGKSKYSAVRIKRSALDHFLQEEQDNEAK